MTVTYTNPISGKLEKLDSLAELVERFDGDDTTEGKLRGLIENHPQATGLVLFENLQMDSSEFGRRQILIVGPGCSSPSIEHAAGLWLNDLPSQRQYPRAYLELPGLPQTRAFDFALADHGSIVILTPNTKQAQDWADEHIDPDHQSWGRNGIVIEPRYVEQITNAIIEEGLTIE